MSRSAVLSTFIDWSMEAAQRAFKGDGVKRDGGHNEWQPVRYSVEMI